MRRWGVSVLAGVGVAGWAARADELGWRPAGPVAAQSAPIRALPPLDPPPALDPWQPIHQPNAGSPLPFDAVPGEPVFRPATAPLGEPPLAVTPVQSPLPIAAAPPFPLPPAAVPKAEALPAPRTLPDTAKGERPDAPPPPTEGAQPTPASSDSSVRVWGTYGPHPGEVILPAGGATPPIRHRTFGSEDVSISRDYHFLDLFGSYAADETRATRRALLAPDDSPATDRFLVQTEYLLWWVQPAKIPVLATTGTPQSQGFLNSPGTQLLLGPGSFGNTARNGFRVRGGWWFDDRAPGQGIDGSFFFLGQQSSSQSFDSSQFPVITRPIFVPNTVPVAGLPGEFGERVAFPGRSTGVLTVDTDSSLWGADINLKCCLCRTCGYQSVWFAGYRYLDLDESLTVTENIISGTGNATPPGTAVVVQDSFGVRNRFNGPQVGYMVFRRFGRVSLDARGSVALGATSQELGIAGFQRVQPPGQPPQVFNGGLLAVGPNLGNFDNTAFSVVPEVTVNLGYQLTPTLRAYVGYNFLFWSNVIRPGDQIDRVVDLSFVPNSEMINGTPIPPSGQLRPQAMFNQSDLWIQGVQFGAELRW